MKVQYMRILFSRVVRRFFNPLKLQRSSFVFAPWSKSSFHKREKSLQRKTFYCSLYTFLFFKNICHNVHESLPWDCFCDARLLYILFLCSLNLCQPFTCKKKKVAPICHTRQVAFATAGGFWEIRGDPQLVRMFFTHFSSLLSQPIHHVYRSESKFGLITQPRQSYNFYFREFSYFVGRYCFSVA